MFASVWLRADSQSLDACDNGVEGGLHVGGGAGGHDGLGLFVKQLGHVLHRETGESLTSNFLLVGRKLNFFDILSLLHLVKLQIKDSILPHVSSQNLFTPTGLFEEN